MTTTFASCLPVTRAAVTNKKKLAWKQKAAMPVPKAPPAPSAAGKQKKARNLIKAMMFSVPKLLKRKFGLGPKTGAQKVTPAEEDKTTGSSTPSTVAPVKATESDNETRDCSATSLTALECDARTTDHAPPAPPAPTSPVSIKDVDASLVALAPGAAALLEQFVYLQEIGRDLPGSTLVSYRVGVSATGIDDQRDAGARASISDVYSQVIDDDTRDAPLVLPAPAREAGVLVPSPSPAADRESYDIAPDERDAKDRDSVLDPYSNIVEDDAHDDVPFMPPPPREAGASVPSPSPVTYRKSYDAVQEDAQVDAVLASNDELSEENRPVAIVELLGEGGFGMVHKCTTSSGALIVVKTAHHNEDAREALHFEAKVLLGLPPSDNIVCCLGFDSKREQLVLKFCDGLSLDKHLDAWNTELRLTETERELVVRDVCLAVEHSHSQGVAHRDIKPDNILVQRDARTGVSKAKLFDFGCATLEPYTADAAGTLGFLDRDCAGVLAGLVEQSDAKFQDVHAVAVTLDCVGQNRKRPTFIPTPRALESGPVRFAACKAILSDSFEALVVHLFSGTVVPDIDREGPYGELVAAVVLDNEAESIHDFISFFLEDRPHLRP